MATTKKAAVRRTGCTARKRARSPHQPVGCWIRKERRLAIYLRDKFTCLGCGADLHEASPNEITLDHVRPRSKGGTNDSHNLYTCCKSCNSSRQDKPLAKAFGRRAAQEIRKQAGRSMTRCIRLATELIADGQR